MTHADATPPPDVLVAVPAKDEERDLPVCLAHLISAASHAQARGEVRRVVVAVAAHRCTDRTAEVAAAMLRGHQCIEAVVVPDHHSPSVGAARAALVREALLRVGVGPSGSTWVFGTDADSTVPLTWFGSTLATARAGGAVAVAGLVEVHGWETRPGARRAYARLLAAGTDATTHTHVYGANLAVRLDAYLEVGGFRDVAHGEDQDLVDRLRAAGRAVATPLAPQVRTSGRTPGRARHGLADLLARLTHLDEARPALGPQPTVTGSAALSDPA